MCKVAILLAAYNGAEWIEEQINSILNQRGVSVTIYISVDNSNDSTEDLVTKLSEKSCNIITLPFGQTFGGAAKNFYRLIKDVNFDGYDFISLSDQDDIWHIDKLERAITALNRGYDYYSSNVNAFWPDGKIILIDKAQKQVSLDHFFEAAGPGCTYVINNKSALKLQKFLVARYELVSTIALHDWFIYNFARNNNSLWYIDKIPSMEYRQHNSNQVGANVTISAALKRIKLIKGKWYRNEVSKISKIVDDDNNKFISKVINSGYFGNILLMMNIAKVRRRNRDRLFLFFACLFNWF